MPNVSPSVHANIWAFGTRRLDALPPYNQYSSAHHSSLISRYPLTLFQAVFSVCYVALALFIHTGSCERSRRCLGLKLTVHALGGRSHLATSPYGCNIISTNNTYIAVTYAMFLYSAVGTHTRTWNFLGSVLSRISQLPSSSRLAWGSSIIGQFVTTLYSRSFTEMGSFTS